MNGSPLRKSAVARAIYQRYGAGGITVPYPRRDVRIVSGMAAGDPPDARNKGRNRGRIDRLSAPMRADPAGTMQLIGASATIGYKYRRQNERKEARRGGFRRPTKKESVVSRGACAARRPPDFSGD